MHSRWSRLEELREAWRNALLHPRDAKWLFSLASTYSDPSLVRAPQPIEDQLWMLQGAAAALATLALCLSPFRYQKPKWVMHDLKLLGDRSLVEILKLLFLCGNGDFVTATSRLDAVRHGLLQGCKIGGFPPLAVYSTMSDKYFYVYRTFSDALSLLNDGDFDGSIYTALYSLRLMNALLQDNLHTKERVTDLALASWRRGAFNEVLPNRALQESFLEDVVPCIHEYGYLLQEEYKRRYCSGQEKTGS